jgi:hypothetical protein
MGNKAPNRTPDYSAGSSCPLQRRAEFAREFGGELHSLPGCRVIECKPGRMQELALEAVPAARAVLGIAGDRVADGGEVDPDLMRAPGLEPCADEGVGRKGLDRLEVGPRLARAGALHGPPGAPAPVPPERRVDRAGAAAEMPLDQGGVLAP